MPRLQPPSDLTVEVVRVDERRAPPALTRARDHAPAAAEPAWAPDDVLRVEHVAKCFGPTVALRDVSMHLRHGEVLGLIGDNASGKSTLIKTMAGFHRPDAGRMTLHGAPLELKSVGHARALGIDCVYQDLALVDQLSAWQNVFLQREMVHRSLPVLARRRMRVEARAALDELGVRIASVDVPVGQLSGGQRQAIALARSLRSGAKILLLDEPIAAMGAREGATILNVIARLCEQRLVAIILVAHQYEHVLQLCHRVNLLEDGAIALDAPASDVPLEALARRVTPWPRRGDAEQRARRPAGGAERLVPETSVPDQDS